jgi:acetoin:2,6-dichlorophenolindophenol oxidoreductase subunit alpha
MYALMVLMKAADDRLSKGIGTGEFMCVYWPSRGQEAIAAAMGLTLRDDDQLVTTYRGLHDLIGKGVPLEEIYGEMMGRTIGASRGKGGTMHIAKPDKGVMLSTGIVGAGAPVGVGLAMAAKRRGLDRVPWSASATAPPTPAPSTRRRTWPRCGTCRWSSYVRTTNTRR